MRSKKYNRTVPVISGIYKITCVPTGKFYIGSAKDIYRRWWRHKGELNTGKHNNGYLQNAYKKYGEAAFVWEVVETCPPELLLETEQHYLDGLNACDPEVGFNLAKAASNPMMGRNHSEDTKRKLKAARDKQTQQTFRCIIENTKEVVRLRQRDIRHAWGIVDYSTFVRRAGHWSRKGLISFPEDEFDGVLYADSDVDRFLQAVLQKKRDLFEAKAGKQRGKQGTFLGKKHSEESKQKMREARRNRHAD